MSGRIAFASLSHEVMQNRWDAIVMTLGPLSKIRLPILPDGCGSNDIPLYELCRQVLEDRTSPVLEQYEADSA